MSRFGVVSFVPYPKITLEEAIAMLNEEGTEGYMNVNLGAVVVRKEKQTKKVKAK